jgi:hypothetical protein
MKDKDVEKAVDCIRGLINQADDCGCISDVEWGQFYMKKAQVEATLLLVRVIQERPLNTI